MQRSTGCITTEQRTMQPLRLRMMLSCNNFHKSDIWSSDMGCEKPHRFKMVTTPLSGMPLPMMESLKPRLLPVLTRPRSITLTVGDYLSFITASGKKGMIRVESIAGTESGTMTISVKVQNNRQYSIYRKRPVMPVFFLPVKQDGNLSNRQGSHPDSPLPWLRGSTSYSYCDCTTR